MSKILAYTAAVSHHITERYVDRRRLRAVFEIRMNTVCEILGHFKERPPGCEAPCLELGARTDDSARPCPLAEDDA